MLLNCYGPGVCIYDGDVAIRNYFYIIKILFYLNMQIFLFYLQCQHEYLYVLQISGLPSYSWLCSSCWCAEGVQMRRVSWTHQTQCHRQTGDIWLVVANLYTSAGSQKTRPPFQSPLVCVCEYNMTVCEAFGCLLISSSLKKNFPFTYSASLALQIASLVLSLHEYSCLTVVASTEKFLQYFSV